VILCVALIAVLNVSIFATDKVNGNFGSQGQIVASEGLRVTIPIDDLTPVEEPEFGELVVNNPSLNWGNISAGEIVVKEIVVTNTISWSMQLSFSVSSYVPEELEQFVTLTWDYDGTPLTPSQSLPIYFQLEVSPLIVDIDEFKININILGVKV
jgi:hypothetical protein